MSVEIDYRDFLKRELDKKKLLNSSYGLRAFSRDLKVAPQNLSRVLMKRKDFSIQTALSFITRLKLNADDEKVYINQVRYSLAKDLEALNFLKKKERAQRSKNCYQTLDELRLDAVSNWHYAAILEMVSLKGFKSDIQWIASQLKMSRIKTQEAVDRLLTLQLLKKNSQNQLVRTEKGLYSESQTPSKAIQKYHAQMMRRAMRSMRQDPIDRRIVSSLMIPADPSVLKEAAKRIDEFIWSMNELLEEGNHEEVYCFSLQLFPVVSKNPE